MNVLIKQATVLSTSSVHHRKKRDILIQNGIIKKIAVNINAKVRHFDAQGLYISIGWLDLFADFCDPGFEHKEDLESGLNLAANSGFTDICLLPNLLPLTTTKSNVAYLKNKATEHICNIHPIGHLSSCANEEKLAEMYDMRQAGAILFGNGKNSVQSAGLLLKALQYVKTIGGTIIQLPDTKSIAAHTFMNEGKMSTALGLAGVPAASEHIQIQRDIALCEYADSKLHFTGISTKKSVDLIIAAQKKGIEVSCSISPAHLAFADEALVNYDSNFKLNPPLREEKERKALVKLLKDGKITAVASHHIPQDQDAKQVEFAYAENGMINMQTTLSTLVFAGLKPEQIASVLGENPRCIAALPQTFAEGEAACLTLFSTKEKWMYNQTNNLSKSENSPFLNQALKGKVIGIINKNKTNLF